MTNGCSSSPPTTPRSATSCTSTRSLVASDTNLRRDSSCRRHQLRPQLRATAPPPASTRSALWGVALTAEEIASLYTAGGIPPGWVPGADEDGNPSGCHQAPTSNTAAKNPPPRPPPATAATRARPARAAGTTKPTSKPPSSTTPAPAASTCPPASGHGCRSTPSGCSAAGKPPPTSPPVTSPTPTSPTTAASPPTPKTGCCTSPKACCTAPPT